MDFISASTLNYRPVYSATTPSEISVTGMTIYYDEYWLSSIETHNAPLPIPTDCEQSNTVGFIIGNTFSDQPNGSNWVGVGTFANNSPIVVTSGQCTQITPNLNVTAQGGCGLTINENIGSATLIASSPGGEPFTYYLDGIESNSPIFSNLSNGGHTAQVLDGDGNLSEVVPFTVNNAVLSQSYFNPCSYTYNFNFSNSTIQGYKKSGFRARLLNTTSNCLMSAKIRIIFDYREWYPGQITTPQTILPTVPSNTNTITLNNNPVSTTWTLSSSSSYSFPVNGCSPTGQVLFWPGSLRTYESDVLTNLSLNSLIEVKDIGFTWTWGSTSWNSQQYPNCKPSVSGTATVQLFDIVLNTPATCQCILPPTNITIGVMKIGIGYVNNVQAPSPPFINTPININCTV